MLTWVSHHVFSHAFIKFCISSLLCCPLLYPQVLPLHALLFWCHSTTPSPAVFTHLLSSSIKPPSSLPPYCQIVFSSRPVQISLSGFQSDPCCSSTYSCNLLIILPGLFLWTALLIPVDLFEYFLHQCFCVNLCSSYSFV